MSSLKFDFTVDKSKKMVYITREFDAGLDLVWGAFTQAELLDQWVAPVPFTARTKYMNFEEGGRRFYAMVSPDGQEGWIIQEYKSITPKTNFKLFNVFADKDENPAPAGSDWDFTFSETNGITTVQITGYKASLSNLDNLLNMIRNKS